MKNKTILILLLLTALAISLSSIPQTVSEMPATDEMQDGVIDEEDLFDDELFYEDPLLQDTLIEDLKYFTFHLLPRWLANSAELDRTPRQPATA